MEFTDKISKIREQLKNNCDIYGNPLVEIQLELSEEDLANLQSYLAELGLTFNEFVWYILEEMVIENEKS